MKVMASPRLEWRQGSDHAPEAGKWARRKDWNAAEPRCNLVVIVHSATVAFDSSTLDLITM